MPGGAPTPQDISLPGISGGRPVAGYDVSGYAQGAEALARSGQQLGAGIEHAGQEIGQEEMYESRNKLLLAQRQANADAHEYISSVRNDPSVTPDQVSDQLDTIRQKYDPGGGPRGDHYNAMTAGVFAETKDQFNQQYFNRQSNEKHADFVDRINQLQNTATWEANPIHESNVRILAQEIGQARDQGFLRPTEAERYWRTLGNGVYFEHYRKGISDPLTRPQAEAELQAAATAGSKAWEGVTPAAGGGFTFAGLAGPGEAGAPGPTNLPAPVAGAISRVANRYGIDPATLSRAAQIESSGDPNAHTGSYKGILQLSQSEFERYKPHPGASIWNADDNLAAGAAKMKAEGNLFAQNFGRQPSGFDQYMIHQQGLAGYSEHLANPNAPAWQNMLATDEGRQKGAAWAKAAIWGNIPTQYKTGFGNVNNVTSRDFLGMWQQKWTGGHAGVPASGAAPQAASGDATLTSFRGVGAQPAVGGGNVINFPSGSDRGEAMTGNSAQDTLTGAQIHTLLAQSRALDNSEREDAKRVEIEQEKRQKLADAFTEDGWLTKIYGDQGGVTATAITADPALQGRPDIKSRLIAHLKSAQENKDDIANFGPGYSAAYKAIMAPPGSDGKITDPSEILRRADPSGGDLSWHGAQRLLSVLKDSRSSVDDSAIHTTKAAMLDYAKSKLSFDQEMLFPGMPPMRDERGRQIYEARFVPKFEAAFDKWRKDGKDPWQFLNQDNVDKLLTGMRDPNEMHDSMVAESLRGSGAPASGGTRKTPQQVTADAVKAAGQAHNPDDARMAGVNVLRQGMSAGHLTRDQAMQIARDRGWAAPVGAPPTVPPQAGGGVPVAGPAALVQPPAGSRLLEDIRPGR